LIGRPTQVDITAGGQAGGSSYFAGVVTSGETPVSIFDAPQCPGATEFVIKSQTGPTSTTNPTSSLDFTYAYQGVAYEFIGNASTSGASYTITVCCAPTVTGISPASGPTAGGTRVTITGSNFFAGLTSVTIGGVVATNIAVPSPTTITVTTGAHVAGVTDVVVTAPGGTATGAGLYTYVGAAPTVTAISPNSGPTAGGTAVTITGANFTGATAVTIGGAAATSVAVVNDTTITAVTPTGTAGSASVLVTTPAGVNAANTLFTYATPAPTVTAISPNSGPTAGGTAVTITGANLTGATAVTIGGAAATNVAVVNATTVTAITSAHAVGPVSVVVTTPGGSGTGAGLYTYVAPAPILHISPTSLPGGQVGAAYSQTLTVTGGTAPFSFSVTSGALPTGLSLSSGGVLTGTPTTAASFSFTVSATDSSPAPGPFTATQAYTIVIAAYSPASPPLTATTLQGQPVSLSLTASASNGPFKAATIVSISPTTAGTARVVASGAAGNQTFTLTFVSTGSFTGPAVVTFTLANAYATSAPATATITVQRGPIRRGIPRWWA
jgi:hypothetical protein